jgi:hypothetical protein
MSIKIKVEREISIASAFTHLIAAWDTNPYSWYRKVHYTTRGSKAIENSREPLQRSALAVVTVDSLKDGETLTVCVDGRWINRALELCLSMGGPIAGEALKIIDEDPSADQNTADVVFQVGVFGKVVFG